MQAFLIVLGGLLCSLQFVWWHLTGQLGGQQHSQQHALLQQQKGAVAKPAAQQQQFLLSVTAGSRGSSPTAAVAAGAAEDWEGGKAGSEQAAAQVFLGALLFSAVASFIGERQHAVVQRAGHVLLLAATDSRDAQLFSRSGAPPPSCCNSLRFAPPGSALCFPSTLAYRDPHPPRPRPRPQARGRCCSASR